MKQAFVFLAFFITLNSSAQLVIPRFNFTPINPTTEYFVSNSNRVVMDFQDSSWLKIRPDSLFFPLLNSSLNHGTPGSILWTTSTGLVRISPITSLPITSDQITSGLGFIPYNATNPSSYITQSGARTAVSLTTTGSGAAIYNNSTGVLNIPTPSAAVTPTYNNTVTRPINSTTYTISSAQPARVYYTVTIQCTATIGSTASGSVLFQYSLNNGTTWLDGSSVGNSNTVSLAVVLNSVNAQTGVISCEVPPNALCRMVSASAGTTSISYLRGVEILY
jgi:hypothetical protein